MFSVVIPTYKSYNRLIFAISSCNMAEIKEVIIIDDNHQKDRQIFDIPIGLREKVVLVNNSKNMGVTYSRNKGYYLAKQEYVIFLDSDDTLISGNISDAVATISNKNGSNVFLFNTRTDSYINSTVSEEVEGDCYKLFEMANTGERLLVLRKNDFRPFFGQLRGHELSGLFFWGLKSEARFVWSPIVLREYSQGDGNSLSGQRLTRERTKLIAKGHRFISFRCFRLMRFRLFLKFLLKACYYDYK